MTYPIRQPPDGDTAWGGDARAAIAGVNDHQTRVTAAEDRLDVLDGVSNIGNVGSSVTFTSGSGNGSTKVITLTTNLTAGFTGPPAGRAYSFEFVITQDATGGRTVTWPAQVKWPQGSAPALSTAPGSVDRLVFVTFNGGTTWYGDLVGRAYA